MFNNKESLRNVAEEIVYLNLLLAILAIVVLYDQWNFSDENDRVTNEWEKKIEERVSALEQEVAVLKQKIDELAGELRPH